MTETLTQGMKKVNTDPCRYEERPRLEVNPRTNKPEPRQVPTYDLNHFHCGLTNWYVTEVGSGVRWGKIWHVQFVYILICIISLIKKCMCVVEIKGVLNTLE